LESDRLLQEDVEMPKPFPHDPPQPDTFIGWLGVRFTDRGEGFARCELDVEPRFLNHRGGVVHGGVIFSLVDTGTAAAVHTVMSPDEVCSTIELTITYLRAVRSGRLVCDSRVLRRGNRVVFLESEVFNDGELVAKGLGTYYVTSAPVPGPEK